MLTGRGGGVRQDAMSKDEQSRSWSVIDNIDAEVVLRRLAAITGANPQTLPPNPNTGFSPPVGPLRRTVSLLILHHCGLACTPLLARLAPVAIAGACREAYYSSLERRRTVQLTYTTYSLET